MLIIPAIDLKDGHCVRLRQGRMEESTIFSKDPVAMATHWVEQGARRLHLVDLDGAFAGEPVNAAAIHAICQKFPSLPIQVGGGIRSAEVAKTYIDAGVKYVIVGTQAVRDPEFFEALCATYPSQVILGLDARDGMVALEGWAEGSSVSAMDLAKRFEQAGAAAIVYTDIARDGMMQGANVEATCALAQHVEVPVIASGGISKPEDLLTLAEQGPRKIYGSIVGRAIYEGTVVIENIQNSIEEKVQKQTGVDG